MLCAAALVFASPASALVQAPELSRSRVRLLAWDAMRVDRWGDDDHFGFSLAATDRTLLVGAPHDKDLGQRSGSAYVFERRGGKWVRAAKLHAGDGGAGHQFGDAVALASDGGTAVVGAFFADGAAATAGAVYVFERGPAGWVETAKLTASDGESHDGFGDALALDGERLLVGASYADEGALLSGSVYVFERVGRVWREDVRLTADPTALLFSNYIIVNYSLFSSVR